MKKFRQFIVLITMLAFSSLCMAQEMNFTISSATTHDEDLDLGIASRFIKQGNLLIWAQEESGHGQMAQLVINSTEGSWNADTSQGQLLYRMAHEDSQITFTLTGDTESITAVLTMPAAVSGAENLEYTFRSCSIIYQ